MVDFGVAVQEESRRRGSVMGLGMVYWSCTIPWRDWMHLHGARGGEFDCVVTAREHAYTGVWRIRRELDPCYMLA